MGEAARERMALVRARQIAMEKRRARTFGFGREFESLREFRDGEEERDSLGAESMFETLDVELASHLSRAKGLGLKDQLLKAFEGRVETKPGFASPGPGTEIRPGLVSGNAQSSQISEEIRPDLRPGLISPAPGAPTTESTPVAQTSGANFTDSHDETAHNVRPVHGEVTSAFCTT